MIFNDTEVSKTCKQITKLSTHEGVLNLKELNNRLGMFVTDKLLDGIKYQSLPKEPMIVSEFSALPKDRRIKFEKDNPEWRRESNVKEWTDKVSSVERHNESEVHWLKFWMTVVDKDRKEKIKNKLAEFPTIATRPPKEAYKRAKYIRKDGPIKPPKEIRNVIGLFDR